MKKWAYLWLMLGLALSACSTLRTSTPEERAAATEALNIAELALETAIAAGKVKVEDIAPARADVAAIRALIAESESVPMTASSLMTRIAGLSVKWWAAG